MPEISNTPPPPIRRVPTPFAHSRPLKSKSSITNFLSKLRRHSKTPSPNIHQLQSENESGHETSYFSSGSESAGSFGFTRGRPGAGVGFPEAGRIGSGDGPRRGSMKPSSSTNPLHPTSTTTNENTPTRPALSISKTKSKEKDTPTAQPTPRPHSSLSISKFKSKEKDISSRAPPPSPNFELTPLSGLIKQSFKDIEVLKKQHHHSRSSNPSRTGQVGDEPLDFHKIEGNLHKFEELYRQHLRYGGAYGESGEEVHLVAMVCKRSDVVRGGVVGGEGVPVLKNLKGGLMGRGEDCGL